MTAARVYPSGAVYDLVAYTRTEDDGCYAVSTDYRDSKPTAVVLVATDASPERLALLHALHESWYPRGDDE